MKKEQIIEILKSNGLNEKEMNCFFNNLEIDIEKIEQLIEFEEIDKAFGKKEYRCWIDTEKSSYHYYFIIKANPILSNDVNIALGKFANYLGEIIFTDAFYDFQEKQVYFKVKNPSNCKGPGSVITLLEAFIWMKEYLIDMLHNNHYDWENSHNAKWNEYTEYLKPIFIVLDKIYNLESVYTLEYEE